MKIFSRIDQIEKCDYPVVTTGTFDGVHLGHQKLIQHLIDKRDRGAGTAVLVTFEPHPQFVIRNKKAPIFLLTTLDEKIEMLQKLGLDCLVLLPFDQHIASMTGTKFIEQILVEKIGAKDIVIGYDHVFGKARSGNIETLKHLAERFDYAVNVVAPVEVNGEVVKSTTVRRYLSAGEVEHANKFLGRRYCVSGKVVPGAGRGINLNFPTANLQLEDSNKLMPGDGVYAVLVNWQSQHWKGIANIGIRPTFHENLRTLEVHIFDLQKELYDKKLQIEFVQKLREEREFASAQLLIQQLEEDKRRAIKLFDQQNLS